MRIGGGVGNPMDTSDSPVAMMKDADTVAEILGGARGVIDPHFLNLPTILGTSEGILCFCMISVWHLYETL